MMKIKSYYSLTPDEKASFFTFLQEASKELSQPAHANMWSEDWQNTNITLPFLLENTDRFSKNGDFHIVFDEASIAACGGVYQSVFCHDLVLAGVRTWIAPDYRNQSIARDWLLPHQKQWALSRKYSAIGLTFNDYNKNIISAWKRGKMGKRLGQRQHHHMFYSGLNEVPFAVTVQYTKQWLIYETIAIDWKFDWANIAWKD